MYFKYVRMRDFALFRMRDFAPRHKSSYQIQTIREIRSSVFTRATSQSPCLHETLTTAAITSKIREAYFISFQKLGIDKNRKIPYNICYLPGYGVAW